MLQVPFKYLDLDDGLPQALVGHQTEVDVREMSPLMHAQTGWRSMVNKYTKCWIQQISNPIHMDQNVCLEKEGIYILGSCAESFPVGDVWIVGLDTLYLVSTYTATETSHACAVCQRMHVKTGN
jgi:hypothetical protein